MEIKLESKNYMGIFSNNMAVFKVYLTKRKIVLFCEKVLTFTHINKLFFPRKILILQKNQNILEGVEINLKSLLELRLSKFGYS